MKLVRATRQFHAKVALASDVKNGVSDWVSATTRISELAYPNENKTASPKSDLAQVRRGRTSCITVNAAPAKKTQLMGVPQLNTVR